MDIYYSMLVKLNAPIPNSGKFFWDCIKVLVTWNLLVPCLLILLVFVVSTLIRLIAEIKLDEEERRKEDGTNN
jgi:hypothetical protein